MTLRGGSGEGSGVENGSVGGAIAEAADQELEMLRTSRHSAHNARGAGAGALGGLRLGRRAASAGAAMMEHEGSRRFEHVRDMVLCWGQEEQEALALALIQQKGQRRVRDTRPATALGLPSTPCAPSLSQPHDSAQGKWQEGGAASASRVHEGVRDEMSRDSHSVRSAALALYQRPSTAASSARSQKAGLAVTPSNCSRPSTAQARS